MRTIETTTGPAAGARLLTVALAATMLLLPASGAWAGIHGLQGASFSLTATDGYISTPDGASIYSWGYGVGGMQYPGPTLIVDQGSQITIELTNALPAAAGNTSIVFPGHDVTADGGVAGLLTREAPPSGTVSYTFTAANPGTYLYHSGTRPDLQVEMGLAGAIVVRSASAGLAYDHAATQYDREYLFLLSEMELEIHQQVEMQAAGAGPIQVDIEPYEPVYWFINGRAAPDTLTAADSSLLPNQPYNIVPRMHPGERVLMRIVGAGRQMHPFHHHGNHSRVIARDGRLLVSEVDPSKLVGPTVFTIPSVPGRTVDAIFTWTGEGVGWDVYGTTNGHTCDGQTDEALCDSQTGNCFDSFTTEYCPDHGKSIPVDLPEGLSLAFGGFYSGSPFLGALGSLPPGEGGLNPNAGFTYMWHSHAEKELLNNDIFPGGLMTVLIVEPPGIPIDE